MKKYIPLILLLVSIILLAIAAIIYFKPFLSNGTPTSTETTDTTADNGDQDSTQSSGKVEEPGRYEYWSSDRSELAFEIDTKSNNVKFYSLQSGYYEYYVLHEGTYTRDGTTISVDIHDSTFTFVYDEESDTYAIKDIASTGDDEDSYIVYERMEEAPAPHPTYDFPAFEDLDFTKDVALGDYKKNELRQMALEEAAFKIFFEYYSNSLESYPEIKDRPVQMGDLVRVDYIGYLGGSVLPNAGGSDSLVPVTLRSENIDNVKRQPDFINGLVGHSIGERFEIAVEYPTDYTSETVAGKTVIFEVVINAIYDVKLTDAQVQTYEDLEFKTYSAYLESVAKQIVFDTGIPHLVTTYNLTELLPESAYMYFYQSYLDQAHALAVGYPYYMEYEEYLKVTGQSEEVMLASAKQMAADFMLSYFIADAFNLKWDEDQYTAQFDAMVKEYLSNGVNKDKAEELVGSFRMDELYAELTYQIAGEWLVANTFSKQ